VFATSVTGIPRVMPWTCPSCRSKVQHSTELPRADRVYRCPVCRLQMRFDPAVKKMQPLPPNGSDDDDKERKVA
jgi:DNA-directed RNA polymerase subunit RPC12/RpoP